MLECVSSYRRGSEPSVLVLRAVHVTVESIQLAVAEVICVHQVELAAGIVVAFIIPLPGEVQPLWMAKLITCS